MRVSSRCLLAVAASLVAAQLPAQWSRDYQPASAAESLAAKQSTEEVYPSDVRDSLSHFAKTVVAWPGIVRSRDDTGGGDSVRLRLEHHYFDWKEDHGCQRELYFLSPRGEGAFTVTVARSAGPASGFTGTPDVGALVLVYGRPVAIDTVKGAPEIILVPIASNAINARWYTLDVMSYGREFSDFKFLTMPVCSR